MPIELSSLKKVISSSFFLEFKLFIYPQMISELFELLSLSELQLLA